MDFWYDEFRDIYQCEYTIPERVQAGAFYFSVNAGDSYNNQINNLTFPIGFYVGYGTAKQDAAGVWRFYMSEVPIDDFNGIVNIYGNDYLYTNGIIDFSFSGLYTFKDQTYKVVTGMIDRSFTGLYFDAASGWWYVEGNWINFGYTGPVFEPAVGGWFVQGGTIDFSYNGTYGGYTIAGGQVVG